MSDLDPKLREAYERVMGTALAANPTQPATPSQQAAPTPLEPAPVQSPAQTPLNQALPTQPIPPPPPPITQQFHAEPAKSFLPSLTPMVASAPATKQKLSTVVIIILGVVFFLVYTIFWIKFFNLSVPFINKPLI